MACSRGKAHPNAATKLRLFVDSAGYCQNPGCNTALFPEGYDGHPHIAEMAHIFAAIDGGPRTEETLTEEERGDYANIILLCANCHTLADKTPESHPATLMTSWKRGHVERIRQVFGVRKFETRAELRFEVNNLLRENRAVHKTIGPDLDYQANPEAEEAHMWRARMRSTIIPNSNKVLLFVDSNIGLLTDSEREVVEQFRLHVKGLILRHLEGLKVPNIRFPTEMANIAA